MTKNNVFGVSYVGVNLLAIKLTRTKIKVQKETFWLVWNGGRHLFPLKILTSQNKKFIN